MIRIRSPFSQMAAALLVGCALPSIVHAQEVVPAERPDADRLADEVRTLAQFPRDLRALIAAGTYSMRLGDLTAASAFFARAEAIDPANPRIAAGRGGIAVRMQRPGEALRQFADAERRGAPAYEYAADRGFAYDLLGQPDLAQRDYRTALGRERDDETVRRYALSLGIVGKQAEAMTELDRLLRQSDRAAWRARAFILAMNGDVPGAERIAENMLPGNMGLGLTPFFRRLAAMAPGDRAFAVHFGELSPSQARLADARLAPPFPRYVPPPVAVARVTPTPTPPANARDERRSRRDRRGETRVAAAPLPTPAPAPVRQPEPEMPRFQPGVTAPAREADPVVRREMPARPVVNEAPPETRVAREAAPRPAPMETRPAEAPVRMAAADPAPVEARPLPMPTPPVRSEPVAAAPAPAPAPLPSRVGAEDGTLDRIVAGIGIPAEELGVPPVRPAPPPAPVAAAPAPVIAEPKPEPAKKPVAVAAKADPKKPDLKADAKPDPKKPDPKKAAAKAPAKPDPRKTEPARTWVQVAGGADEAALPRAWKKLVAQAPAAFKGKTAWTTPLRATNRVLAGPFKSGAEAQSFVNAVKKEGIDAFVFTSEAGQKIAKLDVK